MPSIIEREAMGDYVQTLRDQVERLRTPDVAAVLDMVMRTGQSAFPEPGERVSHLVFVVSVTRSCNPLDLQDEVEAYGDALDALTRVYTV